MSFFEASLGALTDELALMCCVSQAELLQGVGGHEVEAVRRARHGPSHVNARR